MKTVGLCFPSFNSLTGRPSGPTAFAFAITFYCCGNPSSVGLVQRALTRGCCGTFFRISRSNISDCASCPAASGRVISISRECAHYLAAVSFPHHRCSAIGSSSSPPAAPCAPASPTWRSRKRTTATLDALVSQLQWMHGHHPHLRIPCVHF